MAKNPPRTGISPPRRATIAIVTAEFNPEITRRMRAGAVARARELGLTVIEASVAGTYDLPLIIQELLRRPGVDGAVALGAIITGETGHDELIANATARALQEVTLALGKPIGLGVTGPRQTDAQALARLDRGPTAVESVVKQLQTLGRLGTPDDGSRRPARSRVRQRKRRA